VYHFLLVVHVLFAFALVAAVTMFWALILTTRPGRASLTPAAAMTLGRIGAIVVGIAALGAIVFGIWLAIYLPEYHPWDGWILGSIVLWVIAVGTGQRAGRLFEQAARDPDRTLELRRTGLQFQVVAGVALILILVLMIAKPGT
jgi:hypothetical protein